MKVEDFEFLASLLRNKSGLVLTVDKAYLLESRLMPVARKNGQKDLDELVAALRGAANPALLNDVIEAMTTNESLFFRDMKPFDQLRDLILPGLLERRADKKQIRIWCAACSSGQEPYSIAMLLKEAAAKFVGWQTEIVATDISVEMLEKAKSGVYTQFEVQRGLPVTLLVKYFEQNGDIWTISSDIRSMVQFQEFNLLDDPSAFGTFDVVFCRNVLIYFDQDLKRQVLDKVSGLLPADGVLYLGGAETVLGVTERFKPVSGQRGMYAQVDGAPPFNVG
ncbi:MAG: chemotaxis protein CheR [Rhodospirillaceae bacterium]|nr:chemotaxis protein CheR [Rhodospirillaceae bacterium]